MSAIDPDLRNNGMTHQEAVRRARALAPAIRERVVRAEMERRIPIESIEEFVGAGLGRLLQPKRWGGYEISHDAVCDVILEISAACASTGWCCSLLNIHDWWLAGFPDEAQHDVWRNTPDVNLAAVMSPRDGKAVVVDGGYRVSGDWAWASGVDHCDWTIVTALVRGGSQTHGRAFLVPKKDYKIRDTWYSVGMKATGSNNVVVDDAFVPEHRSMSLDDLREGTTPGSRVNTGPLYRIPMRARNHELIAPALGTARGAVAEWIEWARDRVSTLSGDTISESSQVQIRLAHIETDLDAAELLLRRNLGLIRDGGPIDMATRALIFASGARSMQLICHAIDTLFHLSGARGKFEQSSIQRAWRDVNTIASHVALHPDASGQLRGRALLGLPRDPKAVLY